MHLQSILIPILMKVHSKPHFDVWCSPLLLHALQTDCGEAQPPRHIPTSRKPFYISLFHCLPLLLPLLQVYLTLQQGEEQKWEMEQEEQQEEW